MDLKLYALIKSMVKGIANGDKGTQKIELVNPAAGDTLYNNAEYHINVDSGALALYLDFSKNADGTDADPDYASQIVAIFTINESMTSVGFPVEVEWAAAEPVWKAGNTYMLSFIPYDDIIIGVWAVV